jgi:cell division protein FtsB
MTAGRTAAEDPVRSRVRVTPRAALLVVIVVALLLYMAVPFKTYLAQRSGLADLQRQTEVLEQENAGLRNQARRLHDPEYVERLARCDGMVRPGEISFVIVPTEGAEPDTSAC